MWIGNSIGRLADAVRCAAAVSDFLAALREQGGRAGNQALRTALDWPDTRNEAVKQRLNAAGQVQPGKGRGGSVILAEEEAP